MVRRVKNVRNAAARENPLNPALLGPARPRTLSRNRLTDEVL